MVIDNIHAKRAQQFVVQAGGATLEPRLNKVSEALDFRTPYTISEPAWKALTIDLFMFSIISYNKTFEPYNK